ncbi:hypothetical protein LCGC14_3036500 [marine sediment metagenome]|uniref:Uncharacterized protein n=1 Tax=marine sediment metagenome TaxID=412755 RepID=A0A0F8WQL1_9ZZZZ
MKPRYGDVHELDPVCDLSHIGLERAIKKMPPHDPENYCTLRLSANADGLMTAIAMCHLYKLELALSTTYERDEWSLEYIGTDTTTICWSPGA